VVLAFDQLGFGLRLPQGGTSFYARYGAESSIFGHMVKDARSAVDFLYCHSEQGRGNSSCSSWANGGDLREIPVVDFDRVYLMGYCEQPRHRRRAQRLALISRLACIISLSSHS
jgi:hypothetical protein